MASTTSRVVREGVRVRRTPWRGRTGFPAAAGFSVSASMAHNDRNPEILQAVSRAQAGDMTGIDFLYLRYKNNVYGYVLSFVRDEHEAEDVTQQVFVKLLRVIGKYESRAVPFGAWLLRVARNVALDHLRQRRQIPCAEVREQTEPADDSGRERLRGLEQALVTLPADQRNVIMLRHLVGLRPEEIATRMHRTEASVHALHHRGRRALRRELESLECAPTIARAA